MDTIKKQAQYLIIPDIHGQIEQYKAVEKLIKEELQKDKSFHVIFLGDYIDRGTGGKYKHYSKKFKKEVEIYFEDIGSRLVVEKLFELKKYFDHQGFTYTFIRGNHEQEFIKNIKIAEQGNNLIAILESQMNSRNKKTIKEMINTIKGFTQEFDLMKKTKVFFESMPYYFYDEFNKLFFTHAGVEPGIALQGCSNDTYLWIREKFFMYKGTYPAKVIFGHTPVDLLNDEQKFFLNVKEPENIILKEDRIGLDSGYNYKYFLNVLKINGEEYQLIKIDESGAIHSSKVLTQDNFHIKYSD